MTRYFPEVVEAVQGQLPRALRGRRRDRGARPGAQRPGVRGAPAAHPPRREPGEAAGRADARPASSRSTCSRSATRTSPRGRSRERRAGWRRRWPRRAAGAPHADHRRPRRRRASGSSSSRAPAWTGSIAKTPDGTYQPDKRVMTKVKHERTADCVVAGLPGAQDRAGRDRVAAARALRRRRAPGVASGSSARSRWRARRALFERAAAAASRRSTATRGTGPGRRRATARRARRGSRWNAGKDLSFVPLRPERVVEVALRLHGGRALPPHRPVRALAPGPRPAVLHVRAARAAGHVRPGRRAGPQLAASWPQAPSMSWPRVSRTVQRPGGSSRARTRAGAGAAWRPTGCPASG